MKKKIINVLKTNDIIFSEKLLNDLMSLFKGELNQKKEYEILDDFISDKYDDEILDKNVARVINKNTPGC